MMRLIVLSVLLYGQLSVALAADKPFVASTVDQLQQKYQGKNWLMLLWSLDCPPCFKELAVIKQLKSTNAQLPIVIVNVDGFEELTQDRHSVIQQFNLSQLDNYYFVEDDVERSRYQLDPNWHGELPRSYFFDANGKFRAKSGLVDKELIQTWLQL